MAEDLRPPRSGSKAQAYAGLGYQFIWTGQFAVGLGHEIPSLLSVIGAFFGGLALVLAGVLTPLAKDPVQHAFNLLLDSKGVLPNTRVFCALDQKRVRGSRPFGSGFPFSVPVVPVRSPSRRLGRG